MKTITALFDRYDQAAEAVRRLEAAGVSHSNISLVANRSDDRFKQAGVSDGDTHADDGAGTGATLGTLLGGGAGLLAGLGLMAIPGVGPVVAAGWLISTLTGAGIGAAAGGLLGSLVGAGVSEEDAAVYEEGVRRGGSLVTVRAEDDQVDRVVDILDDHGSVDIDERAATYRQSGWTGGSSSTTRSATATGSTTGLGTTATGSTTGYGTSSTGSTAGSVGAGLSSAAASAADALGLGGDRDRTTTGTSTTGLGATGSARTELNERGEAIPIVEESLSVGKRQVSHGRVRVHSHVVERPVEEQVTLRDETVRVERRPVDRPITDADRLFQDRTIEAEERDEEAVIAKQARVKEELVINKEVDQRTETVRDTVRSTEVEVDDERGNRITGTTDRDRR